MESSAHVLPSYSAIMSFPPASNRGPTRRLCRLDRIRTKLLTLCGTTVSLMRLDVSMTGASWRPPVANTAARHPIRGRIYR